MWSKKVFSKVKFSKITKYSCSLRNGGNRRYMSYGIRNRRSLFNYNRFGYKTLNSYDRLLRVTNAKRFVQTTPSMYCMQCEQTSSGVGCTSVGICGKNAATSNAQDLLLAVNIGISQHVCSIGEMNMDESLREETRNYMLESTFSTLTNVNFSDLRIIDYIKKGKALEAKLAQKYSNETKNNKSLELEYSLDSNKSNEELIKESTKYGIVQRQTEFSDEDCFGLRETLHVGLKGGIAYWCHAELMRKYDTSLYSDMERDTVWTTLWQLNESLNSNSNNTKDLGEWLGLCMKLGEINVTILALLDQCHNKLFGTPEPTVVTNQPMEGKKGILLSGHDILDCKLVLDAIKDANLTDEIYVSTHGELLPAHSYPDLKKYPNFRGHFGSAWQNQVWEFKDFPGPIIMTSNCLMPPRRKYRQRLYTTNAVGYNDIKHINLKDKTQMKELLNEAVQSEPMSKQICNKFTDKKDFTIGFGHSTILQHLDTVVNAIKGGQLTDIFFIGGCDGTEKNRSYFHDMSLLTHDKSVILTAGCGKYRLTNEEFGTLGDSGIPRLLDMGQCNDSYSGVVVALKIAEKLGVGLHDLPLHFCVSWFEQKAVVIFLSLLHLGVQNIRLGPELPGFLTPNLKQFLFDNFKVRQVNMDDEEDDYNNMLTEKC